MVVAESDFEGFREIESRGFITFIHERLAHIKKPISIILGKKWKNLALCSHDKFSQEFVSFGH